MSFRPLLGVALPILLTGCLAPPGTAISKFDPGDQTVVQTAPAEGTYGLFLDNEDEPIVRLSLRQGDALGFDHRQGGTVGELQITYLVAVGGPTAVPLQNGHRYQWRAL